MPSREFMIGQAVLDAASEMFPTSASKGRIGAALDEVYGECTPDLLQGTLIVRKTRAHFRRIASQYERDAA